MKKEFLITTVVIALIAIGISVYVLLTNNRKISVSFNTNSDIKLSNMEIKKGDNIDLPVLEREGYNFLGWYLENEKITNSYQFNTNAVLSAKWEEVNNNTFIVTFDSNGGDSISSQTINAGETVKEPSNPNKTGYRFVEWQLNGNAYDFNSAVTANITLVAKWESTDNKKEYTVSFNSNGGSTVAKQTIKEGGKVNKPNDPTRSGYRFVEWQLNNKTYDFSTAVTSDITLVAKWENMSDKKTYTVTFDTRGGGNIAKQTVKEGEKATKPNDPTNVNSDYTFVEWQLDGKTYDFNAPVTANIILRAVWEECGRMPIGSSTKTVKFNTNGGIDINDITFCLTCSSKIIELPPSTRNGFIFVGWYADSEFKTKVEGAENDIKNANWVKTSCSNYETTLYAKWQNENDCPIIDGGAGKIVKFNTNGGNNIEDLQICVTCAPEAIVLPTPTKIRSSFLGWYADPNFQTKVYGDVNDIKGAIWTKVSCYKSETTIYAKWKTLSPAAKPMIYLYPEKEMDINVKLGNPNLLTTVYPKYNNGWSVKAYPSGKLIDNNTGRELYGLYWEGKNYFSKVTNEGFVIKGEDTAKFLEEKLEILGLTERESEEFIVYWLPQMEHNAYNYIRFATMKEINKYMPININPKPDTIIRIMMEFTPLDKKIDVKEQKLNRITRKGFTAVEWGGNLINQDFVK